uniref:Sigma-70 family RNA polymerase sigma factor n=1 Tax=Caldimicrobium thiodismutans TaxID=1653476 RepID=A0A832LW83_9BACT
MSTLKVKEFLQLLFEKPLEDEKKELINIKTKQILQKALKSFPNPLVYDSLTKLYGQDFMEDLTQEFLLKLYQNIPKLIEKKDLSEAYLVKSAKNLIYYLLAKGKTHVQKEGPIIEDPSDEELDEIWNPAKEIRLSYVNDYLKSFIIEGIWLTLKRNLTPKDWEALCFYLKELSGSGTKGLSQREKNAYYKRWERLKPKLRNLLALYFEHDQEAYNYWGEIVERIKSEFCNKIAL